MGDLGVFGYRSLDVPLFVSSSEDGETSPPPTIQPVLKHPQTDSTAATGPAG